MSDHDERAAIRSAARALSRLVNRQGLWEAFQLRPGGSSIWTSAVVLHAMGLAFRACPDLLAVPLFNRSWLRAWSYLDRLNPSAVGFNDLTPADADSTIWLRRALFQRLQLALPLPPGVDHWIHTLDTYIEAHTTDLGVSTYVDCDGILPFVGLPLHSFSSWLLPHSCVSLNRAALLVETGLYSASSALEAVAKSSPPFWWQESQYGAFLIAGASGFHDCGVYVCTLVSSLLVHPARADSPASVVQVLLGSQLQSGLWPALFTLRVPAHSDRTGADTFYLEGLDVEGGLCRDNGILTTALIMAGLAVTTCRRRDSSA